MKNKKIVSILLLLVFIASMVGGISLIKPANAQKAVYTEQMITATKKKDVYDKLTNSEHQTVATKKIAENYKEMIYEAEEKADEAKSEMTKYFVGSAVLVFVAVLMLALLAVILVPKYVNKLPSVDKKEEKE